MGWQDDDPENVDETEDFSDRYERFSKEFLKFERIPEAERLNYDSQVCAILKVQSLLKPEYKRLTLNGSEHDELYLASPQHMVELTDEDLIYLQRCGVCMYNGEYLMIYSS